MGEFFSPLKETKRNGNNKKRRIGNNQKIKRPQI